MSINKVLLIEDPFKPATWSEFECDNLCEFLADKYSSWPAGARIYYSELADSHDVTPRTPEGVKYLESLTGVFYVVRYPQLPVWAVWTLFAIFVVAAFVLRPKLPNSLANLGGASPNNELANRSNTARVNGRIPDIFGEVISVPDLLAQPYSLYENNTKVEYAYMCVGRGAYLISDVQDGTTAISLIDGARVEVFAPFTSPNSGSPQLTIGGAISEPLYNVYKSNSVNGQTLEASNERFFDSLASYDGDGSIKVTKAGTFTGLFPVGSTMNITGSSVPKAAGGLTNVNGTYTIQAISSDGKVLTLVNPHLVNANWLLLDSPAPYTGTGDLTGASSTWVGPFDLRAGQVTQVWVNFIAQSGLYSIDSDNRQAAVTLRVDVELTEIDVNGTALDLPVTYPQYITGSAISRDQIGYTARITAYNGLGYYRVRVRRITDTDPDFNGQLVDDIKWEELYGAVLVSDPHFGNVTTIQSMTQATSGALALKDRKLNVRARRSVPHYTLGVGFGASAPTKKAADILFAIAMDAYIGNLPSSDLDLTQIYNTVESVISYFGNAEAAEFGYTFDKLNVSFEETWQVVANAIFCEGYRQGTMLRLAFEKATTASTMLFNHRNKVPGSESRKQSFGPEDGVDGVNFVYVDPADGSSVTRYIPSDRSATNPKKIDSLGVRSHKQAYWHAYRAWNQIRYRNLVTTFEAMPESNLLVPMDRILVADNTRTGTYDGEIVGQTGLLVTLSQDFPLTGSYTIYLQLANKTVISRGITTTANPRQVTLSSAPDIPLVIATDRFVRTLYTIVPNTSPPPTAFLLRDRRSKDSMVTEITAVNYDSRYYENDDDDVSGVVGPV